MRYQKVFLITGASGGGGKELASILYQKNGKIWMAARSSSKTNEVIREIQAAHPGSTGQMLFLPLVLDDLTTIKASAERFLARLEQDARTEGGKRGLDPATGDLVVERDGARSRFPLLEALGR